MLQNGQILIHGVVMYFQEMVIQLLLIWD